MGQELVVSEGDTSTRRGFDFYLPARTGTTNQLGTLMMQTGGRYVAPDGTTVTVNDPPDGRGAADLVRHGLRVQDR